MVFQPVHQVRFERRDLSRHPERAVVHVAAGAAGDLPELGGAEIAVVLPVEFTDAGEGNVIEVEIEPHANRVGGDEKIDVAVLIKRDLGVARARGQRPEHDSGAAPLPAHQLGDGIDVVGRESDDGAAPGEPGDLLVAGIGEGGEPRARDEIGAGQQLTDRVAHGRGAEEQGLVEAARMEQPVGKDVTALAVGGELDLVDGDEFGFEIERHRLDGADIEAGPRRLELLFSGDERDLGCADAGHNLVVDFAGQQSERKTDDADLVRQHALDGEVGFAGVGRPEHRGDAASTLEACGMSG